MARIRHDLEQYVDRNIISLYLDFDKAHGQEHVKQVIKKSIFLAKKMDADEEMVYVVAAYHDLGMKVSRVGHSFHSARILESDLWLSRWFTEKQRRIMAQAVEDHSKSLGRIPRSLYGKIIYQADMIFDAETIVKRSILFGAAYYQEYTFEQQVERVYCYVNKKYGVNGLLKLWIDIPEERIRLQQLQNKIKDKDYVYRICEKNINNVSHNADRAQLQKKHERKGQISSVLQHK